MQHAFVRLRAVVESCGIHFAATLLSYSVRIEAGDAVENYEGKMGKLSRQSIVDGQHFSVFSLIFMARRTP